ncbi:MAG: 4a-hydroxytetrahydrobiopterin dehydratase [Xanthomonadaceae bacterium]|nr:4a-hydroxytetrahydrobiopterin dehydratase [Xanthomonadaceae bacterium]MDE1961314.1 4a-hydroxytetrahydrobiopterin dehydratase [Xanthomonadaceae bacterium]MDE2084545.1 4a-hydroxytetrahydrobiopterin dehydratase [Xanthomonadaceae bacterium]MDE2257663.1 4a-hydroxytetrahydrobiopterin dehydratase [Xanthomonadaceae bacterium]
MTADELRKRHCEPLKGKENQLSAARAQELLSVLHGWEFGPGSADIRREFRFPDFLRALAFVNALGFIAENENHHPDLELGWGRCLVRFSTHDVGGLSLNDFICAAKTGALLGP